MSAVRLARAVMSHTRPRVVLVDFSGCRSGLPRWMKVGPTPRQLAVTIFGATPSAVSAAQRLVSSIVGPPNAATELATFSGEDGARNALA